MLEAYGRFGLTSQIFVSTRPRHGSQIAINLKLSMEKHNPDMHEDYEAPFLTSAQLINHCEPHRPKDRELHQRFAFYCV